MEFGFLMPGMVNHTSKGATSTDIGDPGIQAKYQFMNEGNTAVAGVARLDFADGDPRFTAYAVPTSTPFFGQIDAAFGVGLNDDAPDWRFQVGLTKVLVKIL
ncbi:MAG TPA: hypothetical protein VJO14_01225 [Bacteroidota bacterium]|nr:hypothetical protein [Bacteroidota bacterium]